jgi:AcrR family transcriptional regulator
VLDAALVIVDRDGVDGLSMRRLAEAVGRDPMVIYRHVPNKAAVLDGVAEAVFAELSVDAAASDWVAEVRRVAREFRRVALAQRRGQRTGDQQRHRPRVRHRESAEIPGDQA